MALVLLGNGKQQRAPKRSSKFNKFVIKSRPIFFPKVHSHTGFYKTSNVFLNSLKRGQIFWLLL